MSTFMGNLSLNFSINL